MKLRGFLPLALLAAVPGCRDVTVMEVCPTTSAVPAIEVEIWEKAGGFAAVGTFGVVRDGAYVDSLRIPAFPGASSYLRVAAIGRPGTYSVELKRTGYRDWTASGIVVGQGVCFVETERVRAELTQGP